MDCFCMQSPCVGSSFADLYCGRVNCGDASLIRLLTQRICTPSPQLLLPPTSLREQSPVPVTSRLLQRRLRAKMEIAVCKMPNAKKRVCVCVLLPNIFSWKMQTGEVFVTFELGLLDFREKCYSYPSFSRCKTGPKSRCPPLHFAPRAAATTATVELAAHLCRSLGNTARVVELIYKAPLF